MTETDLAKPRQPLTRGAKWAAWGALVLSLPLIAAGLWISLAWAEPVYHFASTLRPRLPKNVWQFYMAMRLVGRFVLLISILQMITCARVLGLIFGLRKSGRARRWLIAAWVQTPILFGLTIAWSVLMLPSVTLMEGTRTPPNVRAARAASHR